MTSRVSDFLVSEARTTDDRVVDVVVRDGVVDRVTPAGDADPAAFDDDSHYDADGRLVTPPLVEPHTHLDDAFLAGNPHWNETNTLEEGWRKTAETRAGMAPAAYERRARTLLQWFVANGITRVRSHVNTGPANLAAVDALLKLQSAYAGVVDLQLVAFPSDTLFSGDDAALDRFEEALDRGLDVVGGIPHAEDTREKGVEHVRTIAELADRYDLPLDPHIDETDDPGSRYTEVLLTEAIDRGIGDRTTASHVTAMHSYPNAYADKLIRLFVESGVSVVTNPLSNAVLQGRYDDYPRRRGHTRIDELREAGVPVGIGQDDVVDLFHPYGDGDPLKTAFVLVHLAHMNGHDQVGALWEMLVENNAAIYGLDGDEYGIQAGAPGSLVVYDSRSPFDALRTQPPRTLVLNRGRVVARTERHTEVEWDGETVAVNFDRPNR